MYVYVHVYLRNLLAIAEVVDDGAELGCLPYIVCRGFSLQISFSEWIKV